MDWTVAQGRPLPAARPGAEQRDDLAPDADADGAAPEQSVGGEQPAIRTRTRASRVHGATFLGVIIVVQLAWLMTLGYAFVRLVA